MIIDASVLLSAFFPDEAQNLAQGLLREHITGRTHLKAPALLAYEVTNAIWQAERRGRISSTQADEILRAIAGLELELIPLDSDTSLALARRFGRSAYDAAYLTLAERSGETLITSDERLYNAVHANLNWVTRLTDYIPPE